MPNDTADINSLAVTNERKENESVAEVASQANCKVEEATRSVPPVIRDNADDSAEEDAELLERMRGDAVGETMYSKKFILQTLVKLSQHEGTLEQELEDDLCRLWDMSVSPDVVVMLHENETIELLMYAINGSESKDGRLYEILIGLLGNMCANVICVEQLTARADWVETLIKLCTCMDSGMLLQLMRVYHYIMVQIQSGKEKLATDWYTCFTACDDSAKNFGFILQQSVSDELLVATLKATNAVLASSALVEEENADTNPKLKPFAEVFLIPELCDGVNSAFMRIMRVDQDKQADEVDADNGVAKDADANDDAGHDEEVKYDLGAPKISCDIEVIQTYLNIWTILVQLPEAQRDVDSYAPNIMSCLTRILHFLQQPMELFPLAERQEEYLEDLTHICSCLQYFYDKDTFVNLLGIWLRVREHIEHYTEAADNDFEEEEDVPLENYVENASKLLRLLGNMLLVASETASKDVHEINVQKLQIFASALNVDQDVIFQRAHERLTIFLDKHSTVQEK